jgi:GNAT superfamily N-acetyltransferase
MNTVTIDIRRAEPRDAPADHRIQRPVRDYAGISAPPCLMMHIGYGRRGGEWWANAIRRSATVLVVEIGGKVAGYTTVGRNRARELPQQGEIYELYLRPEYQGVGLGSRLFAAARQKLADHGLKGMVVWALEDNINALSFYAGAGGRDVAEGVEVFDQKALKKVAFVWD